MRRQRSAGAAYEQAPLRPLQKFPKKKLRLENPGKNPATSLPKMTANLESKLPQKEQKKPEKNRKMSLKRNNSSFSFFY